MSRNALLQRTRILRWLRRWEDRRILLALTVADGARESHEHVRQMEEDGYSLKRSAHLARTLMDWDATTVRRYDVADRGCLYWVRALRDRR